MEEAHLQGGGVGLYVQSHDIVVQRKHKEQAGRQQLVFVLLHSNTHLEGWKKKKVLSPKHDFRLFFQTSNEKQPLFQTLRREQSKHFSLDRGESLRSISDQLPAKINNTTYYIGVFLY